jgi:hypothetical protein
MVDARDPLMAQLGSRLDRRTAVKTYAPPALAAIVLTTRATHSISGATTHPNSGRGNGSEGNPDQDPGNSGGHNNGGDGVVDPPGNGNPHNGSGSTDSGGNNGNGGGNGNGNNDGGKGPKK